MCIHVVAQLDEALAGLMEEIPQYIQEIPFFRALGQSAID